MSLFALFCWLLGGDFVFTLMEIVAGNFLPLKLKYLESPNWLIGLVVATVPSIVGMTVSPLISVASDRTRTQWGRRIPYLLAATPPVTLVLVLIGMSDQLGEWLHSRLFSFAAPVQVTLYLVSGLIIVFQFLNVFITNIYIYLFNDVVPPELLSRCMALFKIVAIMATSGFQFFLFGKAETHMREIFIGSAVLYGVLFTAMCLFVKEGSYGSPAIADQPHPNIYGAVRGYLTECFSSRFYWYLFLANMFWTLSFVVVSFRVFFAQSVGLNLDEFGKLMGSVGIASAVLLYPAAVLADRWHPVRVMLLGLSLLLVIVPMQLVFVFVDLSAGAARNLYIVLFVLHITIQVLCNAALMPMFMKLLPQERFGQFFSANGMLASAATIIAGVASGAWIDWLAATQTAPLYQYRWLPLWVSLCLGLSLICMILLYREWIRKSGENCTDKPNTLYGHKILMPK